VIRERSRPQGVNRLKGLHAPPIDHARARLINFVRRHSRDWYDDEVSLLLGDVLGEPIDVTTHRMWRSRHEALLQWAERVDEQDASAALQRGLERERPRREGEV
jgi:hypothetical protein